MTTLAAATDGAEYNGIEIGQGYDCDFAVVITDSTGTVINLTGYTAKVTLRLGYGETAALTASSAVAGSSYCTVDGVNGKVTVHFDHTDTVNLSAPKNYVYDLRLISGAGAETRKLWGKMFVRPQVTASA